jgi:hypothetical protein
VGKLRSLALARVDYSNSNSLGSRLRARRAGPLLALIERTFRSRGQVSILDIGGSREYWSILPIETLRSRRVSVVAVNLPEECRATCEEWFSYAAGDGCSLTAYDDMSFDIVHSNSVMEHLGDWTRMSLFAAEVRRLAPSYFVQTPAFWFPVEPHTLTPFFHWLPQPVQQSLLLHTALGNIPRAGSVDEAVRATSGIQLVDMRAFRWLFPDATILTERVLGFPKSYVALRVRG